jgi:hypothetical protein
LVDGIVSDGRDPVQTWTEIVAAVVMHSSAAAYAHFGVDLEAQQVERPAAERVVARAEAAKAVARPVRKPAEERPARARIVGDPPARPLSA